MYRQINIDIGKDIFLNENSGENPFITIPGKYIWDLGFDTLPYAECEIPEKFPDCCNYHKEIKKNTITWFEKFPDCCDNHRKLRLRNWFDKEKYNHIVNKILSEILYTENFISKNIEKENWYNNISDYIDYSIDSFGTPAVGLHLYISEIKNWIKKKDVFPEWKRNQLIEYVDGIFTSNNINNTDINILYSTFQKWIKALPNLFFINKIKFELKNKVPLNIFLYEPTYNKFSGSLKHKIRTKSELIELLISYTKIILKQIDTDVFLNNGIISSEQKYQIDLCGEKHKIEQNQLLIEYSKKETKYIAIIKKWLKNEVIYMKKIQELTPKLETMPKLFTIEKRDIYGTSYIKLFLRNNNNIEDVVNVLKKLQSIDRANITKNKVPDITIYPAKTYSVEETMAEVELALDAYLNSGKLDPIFQNKNDSLSDKGYNEIIEQIYNYGQNLEKFERLYNKFDEEGFRDFFLPHLNSISEKYSATGETFNKKGKTDILIQDNKGKNVFIAECKLWKGENELGKAIDQLLERYVTWRDEKVAIIIFNKEMKNFKELISKSVEKLKMHSLFNSFEKKRYETSFQFTFKHPDDKERIIQLELIIFNCT